MDLMNLECQVCHRPFSEHTTGGFGVRHIVDCRVKAPAVPYDALARALKLNEHYANLLNMYDGGARKTFTVEEWLKRLETVHE